MVNLLQVAPPQEVTQTLSSTHWGAVLLLTVFVMGAWITYLAYMLRSLNKEVVDGANRRIEDSQEDRKRAEALLERAVTALNQASSTLATVQDKVCDHSDKVDALVRETDKLKERVAQCPHHRGGNQ
jgi:hypothetical protein